jgi:lysophospholipase L1-like esterase
MKKKTNFFMLKNNLLLIVILSMCVYLGNAQSTTYDSSYKGTYYEQKTTLFRLLPNTKNEVIFLGNSITDIGEWVEIFQNKNVKNRGISSDNTFGVLARLDEVLESKPAKVFIMIGINDIARNIPDSIILGNYKKIIQTIRTQSSKTTLIVQSILPTNNSFTQFKNHQNKTQHIEFVNAELAKICASENITFLNLYPLFLDEQKRLKAEFTNDGLHLNGYGYMHWKNILIENKLMK